MSDLAKLPTSQLNAAIADAGRSACDQDLLTRYLANREEAAFARLVERHGGTVWGVCRRVLHHTQDVEDAFQAVFLILARKAALIRKGEAVGSWLYRVAYRTAMKAKRRGKRSDAPQTSSDVEPEARRDDTPWGQAACRELQRMLDEELQNLPEKLRAPFVLCCLEGMSKSEAARELHQDSSPLRQAFLPRLSRLRSRPASRAAAVGPRESANPADRLHRLQPERQSPVLHRKETFLAPDDPLCARFARLTAQEEKHGLLAEPAAIGTRDGWARRLQERGFAVKGHRVVKAKDKPREASAEAEPS